MLTVAADPEAGPSNNSEGQGRSSNTINGCHVDTRYIRSIEGILKLVSLVSSLATNLPVMVPRIVHVYYDPTSMHICM